MTEALAEAVRSASDVAVTATTFDVGIFAGAEYNPPLLIWPQVIPLQEEPVRLQTTTLFVVPLTTAVNCALPPASTCTTLGVSETDTDAQVTTGQTNAPSKSPAIFKIRFIRDPPPSTLPIVQIPILLTSASRPSLLRINT
jgi:hypothetical protein